MRSAGDQMVEWFSLQAWYGECASHAQTHRGAAGKRHDKCLRYIAGRGCIGDMMQHMEIPMWALQPVVVCWFK